jgi:hypothetical protein
LAIRFANARRSPSKAERDGHDLGHDLVDVVNAFAPLKTQRERKRVGEVARVRRRELVGHRDWSETD